jgi:hypothetical protein
MIGVRLNVVLEMGEEVHLYYLNLSMKISDHLE